MDISDKEIEQYLIKKRWKKERAGWSSKNTTAFGPGCYSLRDAYRVQQEEDKSTGGDRARR